MTEIWQRDGWELADDIRAGTLKATDVLDTHLARVEAIDPDLNAWCDLDVDSARARAAEIDAEVQAGSDPGPWAGVPMGVKELAAAKGLSYTEGSLLYQGRIADHDDREVAQLRAAGAVIVGKTTSPEFGSVNWTRTLIHGTTGNAWNRELTPGGSSGGSAAAVASGMMPVCTGSDGGGSIRIPSSYSGLFGWKVTFGLIGKAPGTFDTALTAVVGPMVRSVRDAARYIDAVCGPTVVDATSLPKPTVSFEDQLLSGSAEEQLRGLRVTWSSTLGHAVCDPAVEALAHEAAMALVEDAGLTYVDVDIDLPKPGRAWGLLSSLDMFKDNADLLPERIEDLTPVCRMGYEALADADMTVVGTALKRREEMLMALHGVFDHVDLILTPTVATTAFAAEGPPPFEIAGQRVGGMGSVPYTAPFNISGQPGCSIPVGTVNEMPVGLQVVARRHHDHLVMGAGAIAEANRPWPKLAPDYVGAVS